MAKTHTSFSAAWVTGIAGIVSMGFGCGSSSKPAATTGVTSVDQSKALSSLSTSEMQTLCNDFESYLVQQTSAEWAIRSCIQAALSAASQGDASAASQTCHSAYTQCMGPTNPKNSAGISVSTLCPNSSPAAPACSLTVSQYIACLSDLSAAANAAWALRNEVCDNLASCPDNCSSPMTLPMTCSEINTTCSGIGPQVIAYVTVS